MAPTTTSPDDILNDEDYPMESSTHGDWEESTGLPDISKNSAENDNVQSNSDWLLFSHSFSPILHRLIYFFYLLYVFVNRYP